MLTLKKILKNIEIKKLVGDDTIAVSSVQFDSRELQINDLFVAVRGTNQDGHSFISMAIEKGAKAIVCETMPAEFAPDVSYVQVKDASEALSIIAINFYDHPSEKLKLIGVTGTNGKTTIATLLYDVFRRLGYKVGLISTVINYIDDQPIEATHTTPDALNLNKLLFEMLQAGCTHVFMEVSSHAIDQNRVAGLNFVGAVFTNLTRDHIDYHETFENYRDAKKKFFDALPSNSFALTNIDDKNGLVMLQNTKAKKYSYTLRSMADFKTRILESGLEGTLLTMNDKEIFVSFVGRFNASNLTAVYGAAVLLGEDELEALTAISTLKPVAGRFETFQAPNGYIGIVDYAHTPDALNNVISTINQILRTQNGRLISVVGCGGNRDKGKRPLMAKEAVDGSWKAILTSDNPRFEEPEAILDDMVAELDMEQKKKILRIENRREAIRTACALAQKGDVVLIAGKGHEDYQIIQGVKHHFDDREELKACF